MRLAPRAPASQLASIVLATAAFTASEVAAAPPASAAPKTTAPAPSSPTSPRPAGVAPSHVDLLRSTATEVRVSSTVKNAAILPAHLVDGDLSTAWNSVTGELYGAWIEVRAPAGASIKTIRLTPGFTGAGPKGEPYFTMNPRIERVLTKCDGAFHAIEELDADRPELQSLTFSGCKRVRLEVVSIRPGTKPSWREISISELEVWGTPPTGWTAPKTPLRPTVSVGPSPREATEAQLDKHSSPEPINPCEGTEKEREDFERERQEREGPGPGAEDRNYPPDCKELAITLAPDVPAPWSTAAAWCETPDEIYGSAECSVFLQHRRYRATILLLRQGAGLNGTVSITTRDVLPSPGPEALVRLSAAGSEYLSICRTSPYLSCSPFLLVADSGWRTTETFTKGALTLKPASGTPSPFSLGTFRLVFSSFSAAEAR